MRKSMKKLIVAVVLIIVIAIAVAVPNVYFADEGKKVQKGSARGYAASRQHC